MRSSIIVASLFVALAVLSFGAASVSADTWAVLVAGSNTWGNYRHQADVCHAYQILVKNGVKPEHIITFEFDDLWNNTANPYPGQVFNHPTANGTKGIDVYGGCKIDYSGGAVLPEVFLDVIQGRPNKNFSGPYLQSTSSDNVFMNFVDHGSPGTIYFPGFIPFQGKLWIEALKYMNQQNMYAKMVIYLEACEAGSIFDQVLPNNIEIYATTAANPDESSWGTYCPGETPGSSVDGIDLETCLGDLYSVNWMEDSDQHISGETLEQQFNTVVKTTNLSHPQQYGDLTWTALPVTDFLGQVTPFLKKQVERNEAKATTGISNRDVNIHTLYRRYLHAAPRSTQRRELLRQLDAEIDHRQRIDDLFTAFATGVVSLVGPRKTSVDSLFAIPYTPIVHDTCMIEVDALYRQLVGYSEYSTQYAQVFINACRVTKDIAALKRLVSAAAATPAQTRSQ